MEVVGSLGRAYANGSNGIVGYSGFGPGNYLTRAKGTDFDVGTADWWTTFWLKMDLDTITASQYVFALGTAGFTGSYIIGFMSSASNSLRLQVSDDGNSTVDAIDASPISNGVWRRYSCGRIGGNLISRVDGEQFATVALSSALNSLTPPSDANLRIGVTVNDSAHLTGGDLSLFRFSKTPPTEAQDALATRFEAQWFQPGGTPLLGGSSNTVTSIDYDFDHDTALVGTADGVSIYSLSRFVRTDHITSANSALTSNTIKDVSVSGDMGVITSDAETVFIEPAKRLLKGV